MRGLLERSALDVRIRAFRAEDALAIAVQDSQALEWHDRQALGARFAASGRGFTILDREGRPIFCGGAQEVHSEYAHLWAVFGRQKRGDMVRIQRATIRFIFTLPHRRVDTFVIDRPEAITWAKLVGLKPEGRLRKAAADGGDLLVFRRGDLGAPTGRADGPASLPLLEECA